MTSVIPADEARALATLDEAKRQIALAREMRDTDFLGELRDRAKLVALYHRRRDNGRDAANDAGEIKVRAEHALGAIDGEVNPHGGDRVSEQVAVDASWSPDVAQHTRAAWRKLGRVDDTALDEAIAKAREREDDAVTTMTILRFVRRHTDVYVRNAAGAHEGVELSDGDAEGDGWKLLLGRFQDRFDDIPEASVDAIITDPPYPTEYIDEWRALGALGPHVLRPGGVVLARCGHLLLPEYIAALQAGGLQFGWIYNEPLPGSNVRFQGRKIAVSWQPWLALSNGPWPSGRLDWHRDTLSESPRVKERYVWEQKWTVAAELAQEFTVPGSIVFDPFAGSGAYGQAALAVGCRWIGIEADPAGHRTAAERLGPQS